MKIGRWNVPALYLLLVFVPISVLAEVQHWEPTWIFVTSCIAVIPLAGIMGKATEHLAAKLGAGLGGLLNATFGNAAELIIALIALNKGLVDVVKASVTGSIIGNILLVLGLSLLCGGVKFKRQTFNQTGQSFGATLLVLSVIGLVIPAALEIFATDFESNRAQHLSLAIAIVLFVAYVLSLVFSLSSHRHLFGSGGGEDHHDDVWSRKKALTVLILATIGVAMESEFLVASVEATSEAFGLSSVFVGVIIVAVIGNAAEHSTAILMSLKNKNDLALNIAIGSSLQVALLIAPVLVFASYFLGPSPMNLMFTPLEVLAVVLSVWVVTLVAQDGESHWMEGVLLLAVYIILGIAFYFLPGAGH